MKIPQLFIQTGKGYVPVSSPIKGKELYYWDDTFKTILPARGRLKKQILFSKTIFVC